MKGQRSRPRAQPNQKLSGSRSMSVLTPPREDSENNYEHLDCRCRTPKDTTRSASGIPPTENGTISSGDSLYHNLLSSLQSPSQNSAPPELRVAPTIPLINQQLIKHDNLDLRQTSIAGRPQEVVQTPIKTVETQGPNEKLALNDNITNTTTLEPSQENHSKESIEIVKETEDKDEIMQMKKKQSADKRVTPKVSKAPKASKTSNTKVSTNQQSDFEDDLPPRISRLPGYSPSEHLERRKLDQALIGARGGNRTYATNQQSDADSDLAPRVKRIPGQSPSEHLDRILSANIPDSVSKRTPAYKSTGSVFRSGGSSHFAGRPRGSLMMSEVESGSLRVSHEEDMASLASLAQVLKSESNDEFVSLDPSGITTEFVTDYGGIDYTPTNKSSHKRIELDSAKSKKTTNSAKRTSFAADLGTHPSHYKKGSANSATSVKRNTAGIQSLIGKFNSVDQDAVGSPSASPTRSPATVGGKYSVQFPITTPSAYAMNSSLILNSHTALNSSKGFVNETGQQDIDMGVLSPKSLPPTKIPRPISASLLSITHQAKTQLPFKPLKPTKKHSEHKSAYMDGGYNSSPVQPSFGLFRDGGGNENVGTPGQSSKDKIRSKHAEITIWDDTNESNTTPEPRSTSASSDAQSSVDPHSSNLAEVKPGPSTAAPAPVTPAVGTGAQGKGTSVLFSQVTNLQRLLDARTEEADSLKKQLATKGSLNDLGTLAEQLREAKRETAMWQKRAETAERHLERLSQFNPATISEAMAEESAYLEVDATRVARLHAFPVVGKRESCSVGITGSAQHGNVDGARSSGESTDTQGTTIMRTIPELRGFSADEPVASYGTFGRIPRKFRGTSGEDLITFSEAD